MRVKYLSFLLILSIAAASFLFGNPAYAQVRFDTSTGSAAGGLIGIIGETILSGTAIGIVATGAAFVVGAAITLPLIGVAIIGGSVAYVGGNYLCSAYCGENNFISDYAKKYVETIDRSYFQLPPEARTTSPDLFVDAGPELVLTPEEKEELRDAPRLPTDSTEAKRMIDQDTLDQLRKETEEAIRQLEREQQERERYWRERDPLSPSPEGVKDALERLDPKSVTYEEALAKARSIGDGIISQIISQISDPVAEQIANAAASQIEEIFARSFSNGTFYTYDQNIIETLVYNQITPEVDRFLTDPNSRQAGYGIARQIASQMAEQFYANPFLDSVKLTLTVDKPAETTDEEIMRVINELKILQGVGPKYGTVLWKGIAAGLWTGDMQFKSQDCGLPKEALWVGSWSEGEQIGIHTAISGERRYLSLLGDMEILRESLSGLSSSVLEGLHYVGTNEVLLFTTSRSKHEFVLEGRISGLSGDDLFDKRMTGTLRAVCPTDRSKVIEGTFSGNRYKSDITGLWSGSFDITGPAACAEKSSWKVQFTEVKRSEPDKNYFSQIGDVIGMFEKGDEKLEARGVYIPNTKEMIWVAGDYAFLGKISGGVMSGTMLGRDCEKEGEYPEGKHRRGTFQANFVER